MVWKKEWLWAALAVVVAAAVFAKDIAGALGVRSPETQFTDIKEQLASHSTEIGNTKTEVALIRERQEDFAEGLNRLLENEGLGKIPRRARGRRADSR